MATTAELENMPFRKIFDMVYLAFLRYITAMECKIITNMSL